MKKVCVAVMAVLSFSSMVLGTPVFSDDFSSIDGAKWNVDLAYGSNGPTGNVTAVTDGSWTYAQVFDGTSNAGGIGWKGSTLATKDAFDIGQGLNVGVTLMFPSYEPGLGDGLTYRPNMTLQDASGVTNMAIYSPFSSGAASASIKMQTLNSGTLADTHSTPSVGTSGWYLFDMDVYTDHANIKLYENGTTLRDQWTITYDSMSSLKMAFSANAPYPGWGPDAKLLVDKVEINTIPEPATFVLLTLGTLLSVRRKR
jgi:hypothetical protein